MQLDIFEHSRDVMLRNDVIDALQRHDAAAARAACDRFDRECAADPSLTALCALLEDFAGSAGEPFHAHAALAEARQAVEALEREAERVFGLGPGRTWLAALWKDLASRARALAFRADKAQDHAAPLDLRAHDWEAAIQAVSTIESWRRIPAPLAWMTEARLRLHGLQPTWPLIAELGWLSPGRLGELLRRDADPLLSALAHRFGESFEGAGDASDAAWFAAWVLTDRPEVVDHLALAQASRHGPPEHAFRLLVELLGLERQGRQRDIVDRRRMLRDLHAPLYQAYMRTR
jgi:hypothetical protein